MINAYSPLSFSYIEEIFHSINKNLILASKKDNQESFNELLDFIFSTFISKSFNTSLESYSRAVKSLVTIYPYIESKYKELMIGKIADSLLLRIYLANDENVDKEYLYLSFETILNIIKIILEEDNYILFNIFFNNSQKSIFRLKTQKNKCDYLFKFSTSLLCWFYFLRFKNKISHDKYNIQILENLFSQLSNNQNINFIDRFYKLYDEIENKGLWYIEDWQINEPPLNVVFTSLMPRNWLPFSLTLILLKNNHLVQIKDIDKIEPDPKFRYQLEDINKILESINLDNKDYSDFIFPQKINNESLEEQLKYRKEKVKELFTILKRKEEIKYFTIIKSIPLSQKRIDEFRKEVGKNWENSSIIFYLLKSFNKVNYKKNIEDKDGYGFFHTIEKGKFSFIEGEYYQNIYGLSDFGNELARNIDNSFFKMILDKAKIVEIENLDNYIDKYILDKKNIDKVVIFSDWVIEDKLKNIEYTSNQISFSYANIYNIPIINSHNNYDDYIFIVDFNDIEVDIYISDSKEWYNQELYVDVTEFQKSEITDDKIKRWKEKDKQDYSEKDVDILESNNINIKVIIKNDYLIKSYKNIKVLKLKI